MIVGVLVEIANKRVDKIFDYKVPSRFLSSLKIGVRVRVPFGNRILEGFILEIKDNSSSLKLKEIIEVIDSEVVLNKEMLELGKWLQQETLAPLIACYQVMLPKALKAKNKTLINKKYEKVYTLNDIKIKLTDKQEEIVKLFKDKKRLRRSEINDISKARLDVLVKKNVLTEVEEEVYRLNYQEDVKKSYNLTALQRSVVDEVINSDDDVYLLYGVTGSGKTLVYITLIEEALKKGKQSIVLVPEISLTPQMVNRFKNFFGKRIAALHSALSDGEKYDEWRRIEKGEVDVVIGARSAVFAPLSNLAYIIMDEEHSDSYKQESNPKYDTRSVALKRAEYHQAKVILGSATPTLESFARAKKGVYHLLTLDKRVNGYNLPSVKIIDMNKEAKKAKGSFSEELINAIDKTLKKKEQVILLLNRRGYSPIIRCRNCQYVYKCPNCDITLTYHKTSRTLRCHYCGYGTNLTKVCPSCHHEALKDLGVGTEKIEEELHELFKGAKVIRMDIDTTSRKGAHEALIKKFQNHEADILLGTQMVAKGLDFENVTLVGVINADTSLLFPDFRSSEATFDLLNQTAGRSGRGEKEGLVYFQTYNSDHYAIKYAKENNYLAFYQEEMNIRRMMKYPPYYYLVAVLITSKSEEKVHLEALKCSKVLEKYLDKTIILGPTKASIYKKANIYRYQIILKYQYQDNLKEILNRLLEHYKLSNDVSLEVDFNPVHLN